MRETGPARGESFFTPAIGGLPSFSLRDTLESGQIFRWENSGGWSFITVRDCIIKIRQEGERIFYGSSRGFDVPGYFDLRNEGYAGLMSPGKDRILNAAVRKHPGLRIIRQDPWECTASFICSSYSNIKRIRQNLNSIASLYGEEIEFEGFGSRSFPSAEAIAASPGKLGRCGLGYREKYLAATAKKVSSGFSLESLRGMGYPDAKQKLMELDGVGSKVADCILLFSLGFSQAFPVDVWIERAMKKAYPATRGMAPGKISEYGMRRFGSSAGYAQQFIYHYARSR